MARFLFLLLFFAMNLASQAQQLPPSLEEKTL